MSGKTIRLSELITRLIDKYLEEKRMESLAQGIITDRDVVERAVLDFLKPWLESKPSREVEEFFKNLLQS